ncbi:MAG: hypothetical protein IJO78_05920, partial [Erysipelotrichaceae bacterium]|nr:hypothetical protein [Erysipelotrichaceae bacterium]
MAKHTEEIIPAVEATCTSTGLTEGKKCSVCNTVLVAQEETPMLDHNWDEGQYLEGDEPTCIATGTLTYTCKNECGTTKTTTVAALGHTDGTPVQENVVEATCKAPGSYDEVVYCTVCNTEVSRVKDIAIPISEVHTWSDEEGYSYFVNGEEPTCTEEGQKTYLCTVCKEVTKKETVAALGHTEEEIPAVEATCTKEGSTAGVKCSVCDVVLTAPETVEKKAHTEEVIPAVDATCTSTGLTYGKKCTVCGETTVAQEEVAVLPHTEEVIPAVDATCTSTGLTEGKKCSVCKTVLVAQEVTPMVDHNWGEGKYANESDKPNCTKEGKLTYTCQNDGCNATKTETVAALGHTKEVIPAKEATCTKTGLTEGAQCSVCFAPLVAQEVVPALTHAPLAAVQENVKAATCYEKGSYEEVVYCSRENCDAVNKEISRTTKEIDMIAHTPADAVKEEVVEATCTTSGSYYNVVYCSVEKCKHQISKEYITVDALGHTEGSAATCTTPQTCTVCGDELVAKLGHDYVGVETTAPKCEETGVMTYTCSRCGDSYTEEIAATGHRWLTDAEGIVYPTCTKPGSAADLFCRYCGAEVLGQPVPATGHEWGVGVVETPATCEAPGLMKYTCIKTNCDGIDNVKYEEIPQLDHTIVDVEATAPTCTETGLTAGKQCSVCETWTVPQTVVPKLGHDEEVVKGYAATCEESGLTDGKYCNRCYTWIESQVEIPKLGHTEEILPAVAPKCEETGLTEGKKCSVCDKVLEEQEVVPALGHDWQDVKVTLEPSCEGTGTKQVECSVCHETKYVVIPSLGHNYEPVLGYDSTCYATGLTDGSQCTVCNKWETEQTEIAKKEHTAGTPVQENVVDSTCYKEGSYDEVVYCSVCAGQQLKVELSRTQKTIAKKDHTPTEAVVENEVDSTCYAEGSYDSVVYCSVPECKHEISRTEETIAKKEHT